MSGPTKPVKPAAPKAPPKPHHRAHVKETTLSSGMPGYEEALFKALTDQKARAQGQVLDWSQADEVRLDAARIAAAVAKKLPPVVVAQPQVEVQPPGTQAAQPTTQPPRVEE